MPGTSRWPPSILRTSRMNILTLWGDEENGPTREAPAMDGWRWLLL